MVIRKKSRGKASFAERSIGLVVTNAGSRSLILQALMA